ncbi:MAG: GNAT family N-acetyltransferase [Chloroflexota bacterium]
MQKTFDLRPATKDDTGAIRALVLKARINPTALNWCRFTLAVSPQGEVIGCLQVKPHRDGSWELASLVVAEGWQGRGVARALIEHLTEIQPASLYLMCRASLEPFYRKFGFRVLDDPEMPPYFQRVKRLSNLIDFLAKEGEYLLVMKRE